MSQEAYDKAMEELDELAKSQKEEKTEELETLDDLTKSLEEELGEDLSKSEDGDADDKEEEEEGEEDKEDDGCKKSEDLEYDDELVKASEAYASLEKSVVEGIGGIGEELGMLRTSMAALMNLNIKQAKVIAQLSKSRQEDIEHIERIEKSLTSFGSQPVAPNKAVLGVGQTEDGKEQQLTKSVSEVRSMLIKAVGEEKVDARWLSLFDSHKTVDIFDQATKTAIGI